MDRNLSFSASYSDQPILSNAFGRLQTIRAAPVWFSNGISRSRCDTAASQKRGGAKQLCGIWPSRVPATRRQPCLRSRPRNLSVPHAGQANRASSTPLWVTPPAWRISAASRAARAGVLRRDQPAQRIGSVRKRLGMWAASYESCVSVRFWKTRSTAWGPIKTVRGRAKCRSGANRLEATRSLRKRGRPCCPS